MLVRTREDLSAADRRGHPGILGAGELVVLAIEGDDFFVVVDQFGLAVPYPARLFEVTCTQVPPGWSHHDTATLWADHLFGQRIARRRAQVCITTMLDELLAWVSPPQIRLVMAARDRFARANLQAD